MSIFVDIEKKLGNFRLKIKFEAGNEVLSLLGASGCGKSMTLRCIAGIETPDRGKIVVDGTTLFDSEKRINLPPQKRRVGLMFQNYALFPNMTVYQNLQAGCRRTKTRGQNAQRIREIMEMFELTELSSHYPSQLSGGQQQRTALARILLSDPNILLLDEPFSALDAHLRVRLEQEMIQVIKQFGKSVLLVSHDRDEVYRMSDRICVMHNGLEETQGTKEEVFAHPKTRQAAILTGCKNIAPCESCGEGQVSVPDWGIRIRLRNGEEVPEYMGIRANHISMDEGEYSIPCRVGSVMENPFTYICTVYPEGGSGGNPITWEVRKEKWNLKEGELMHLYFPEHALFGLSEKRNHAEK